MSALAPLEPYNEHNQLLESHVHPQNYQNPTPHGKYNIVVIGAGPAGLVTAAAAAGLGAKVALIEKGLMGGDCLNVGCVPSKGVISAARIAASVRDSKEFGIHHQGYDVDFEHVMNRMRKLRAEMSHHDSTDRFSGLGIDVFIGKGEFKDESTIVVDGAELKFTKAVIATGARAAYPDIPGINDVGVRTNETIFSLTEQPRRLIVIGGGPIGSEMAQSFARLGTEVTQIEKASHILAREEPDAAQVVIEQMKKDGVKFLTNATTVRFEKRNTEKVVFVQVDGKEQELVGDEILLSVGRTPNVDNMGLEKAGIEYDLRKGIKVNDYMQTTNNRIFAAGDVASKYQFTHAADFAARTVIRNALFMGRGKASSLVIPWTTYTSPEVAHVGLYPHEADAQGLEIVTYTQEMSSNDRAILEGETDGFVRVHLKKGTDKILGATVVATNAGDLINEFTLAITHGLGLSKIGSTIHPYPTQGEAIRKLGDQYNRTKLTPFVKGLFKRWLKWNR